MFLSLFFILQREFAWYAHVREEKEDRQVRWRGVLFPWLSFPQKPSKAFPQYPSSRALNEASLQMFEEGERGKGKKEGKKEEERKEGARESLGQRCLELILFLWHPPSRQTTSRQPEQTFSVEALPLNKVHQSSLLHVLHSQARRRGQTRGQRYIQLILTKTLVLPHNYHSLSAGTSSPLWCWLRGKQKLHNGHYLFLSSATAPSCSHPPQLYGQMVGGWCCTVNSKTEWKTNSAQSDLLEEHLSLSEPIKDTLCKRCYWHVLPSL